MLISEFAKAADLPIDTVRFYVRLGLLEPATSLKGGSRPYAIFSQADLERAMKVRILQYLGYPLREIAPLVADDASGRLTAERSIELLRVQLAKLIEKRRHLDNMIAFVGDRIASLQDDQVAAPEFGSYLVAAKGGE